MSYNNLWSMLRSQNIINLHFIVERYYNRDFIHIIHLYYTFILNRYLLII